MNDLFTIIGYLATAGLVFLFLKKLFGKRSLDNDILVDIQHPEEGEQLVTKPRQGKVSHNLSQVQEMKLTFLFNLLDFNRNGHIQQDDLINVAENMSIIKAETLEDHHLSFFRRFMERSWNHLSYFEKNHYKISLYEWLHFADQEIVNCNKEKYTYNIEKLVHAIFLFFDDNKDKHLSVAEYMSLLASFRADFRSAKRSFDLLDTNNDGLISEQELSQAVWKFFHSSDPEEPGNWLFGDWKTV